MTTVGEVPAMTTTKTELHDVLNEMRSVFLKKVEQLESTEILDLDTGTGYTNHQADDATMVYDQTVNASTLRGARDRLRQIEEALGRYDTNTYGICQHCGREIDIARLEAIPYTPLCLSCAEARDYYAGM
jgi:RNA polymerase-binding transcription factor DksA